MANTGLDERLSRLGDYLKARVQRSSTSVTNASMASKKFCPWAASESETRSRHRQATNRSRTKQTRIPHFFKGWKCRLPDLPLDILVEIASHMHPLDLLHLSRVSKAFRTILASRDCRVAWVRALQSVPDLPPCPEDMSELLYVALIFGRNCFACGADKACSVDYALRVRYCESCYDESVVEGAQVLYDIPNPVRDVALMLIPAETTFAFYDIRKTLSRLNPATHMAQDFYLTRDLEAMEQWCLDPPSPERFDEIKALIRERVEDVAAKQAQGVVLDMWERLVTSSGPEASDYNLQRRARVLSLIRQKRHLGTPFERADGADSDDDGDYCEVDARDLTPAIINCATPPKDVRQLEEEEEARFEREDDAYNVRLEARYTELGDCYERFMRVHGPLDETYDERCHPNRHDGGRLFSNLAYRNNARTPVDYDTFASDLGLLEDEFYGYERHLVSGLAALLPGPTVWTTWLKWPNALYFCPECAKTALPWPDINVHWREEHPEETIWAIHAWHRPKVKWWRAGEDVAHRILDVLRLSRTTPMYQLNEYIEKGRLYCNCGDPSWGPANRQAWAELVLHVYTHLRMNEDRMAAVDDQHVWHDDHKVEECIVKLKLEETVEPAQMHFATPEASVVARVDAHLTMCPSGLVPICRVCKEMTRKDKDMWMVLPPNADAVLYHISAKHGRTFDEADILFEAPWYLPRHRRHMSHWGRFALEGAASWAESVYLI